MRTVIKGEESKTHPENERREQQNEGRVATSNELKIL